MVSPCAAEPLGGWPGEDWLYPFPSDHPDFNSSMMFNNDLLLAKVVGDSISKHFGIVGAAFEEDLNYAGPLKSFVSTSKFGDLSLDVPNMYFTTPGNLEVVMYGFKIPLYKNGKHGMYIRVEDGTLIVGAGVGSQIITLDAHLPGEFNLQMQFDLLMNARVFFDVSVHPDSRKLEITELGVGVGSRVSFVGEPNNNDERYVAREISTYPLGDYLEDHLKGVMGSLFTFDDIDAFVLNSILFGSTDAVRLQRADLPGDLLVLGSISPRLTTFSVNPAEKLMGYGATHTFATSPPVEGVTWSVQNVDGSTLNAGTIDAQTGVYIAPGLDQIDGTFKWVKVTAATAGHTSKALVTIARRAITLNPQLQVSNASNPDPEVSPETVAFSANALTGALKWSVTGDGSIPETAQPDRTNLYSVPRKKTFTDKTFTIDEIKVTNTQTTQVQSAFVLVEHHPSALAVEVELEGLAPEKAQFSVLFNGTQPPDVFVTHWRCFPETGAGSIDSNGLYTADPTSPYPFVIIKSALVMPGPTGDFFLGDGYSIQPLPLAPLPPKPSKPEDSQTLLEETPQT